MNTPDMRLVPGDWLKGTQRMMEEALARLPGDPQGAKVSLTGAVMAIHALKLDKSLAASPSPSVGAVAWQCRRTDRESEWGEIDKSAYDNIMARPDMPWEARPLFAHPAPDASAVREGLDPRLAEWGYSSTDEAIEHLGKLLDDQTAFDGLASEPVGREELRALEGWGDNWILAKGQTRPDEPLYGCQLFAGEEAVAEGEGDTALEAINAAFNSHGLPVQNTGRG